MSRDERGETLLELLIAVVIMGIAMVAIVGGLVTAILMSDIHRKQSTAGAAVRDYAERIETYVAGGNYVGCAPATAYAPGTVGYPVPSGFSTTATVAQTWNGSSWGTCSADNAYQKISLTVSSADGRASEKLDLVLRRPCRPADSTC